MVDFKWFLNRQGIQGRKGEKGDTGFSPTINVGTDTLDEYKLIIANESNTFETPNLRGNINIQDNGGTYLRYDTETKQISAQSMDAATADTVGGVRLSTEADIVEMGAGSVVTPSDVADALPLYLEGEGAVTITQDELTSKTKIKVDVPSVNDLESRMSTAEAEIADIQTDVANLNNNKVAKTDLATIESAGIVKVDGTSITVTANGTISASPSGALPIASTTQLGGVKVDGTSIIADENGVISSVGGGGAGDVTASGNNVFTGNNEFKKDVTITCANDLSNPSGLTITNAKNPEGYKTTFNVDSENGNFRVKTNEAIELMSQFATYIDGGQSNLSVHNNGITFTSNDVLRYYNNDGSYNYVPLVTQENIKAGENITLNKNAETGDITISSTGGGGTGDIPIATTATAGKVKPDGTTITITDDGTISASSGGGGDVTAAGDNTFTGSNTFNSYVTFNNGFSTTNNAYLRGDTYVDNGSHYFNYSAGSLSMNMPIKCNNSYVLTQNALVAGDGITLANTSQGVQISATGGGGTGDVPIATTEVAGKVKPDGTTITVTEDGTISAVPSVPTNMVTTDTSQTISGAKTFTQPTVFKNTLDMSTNGTDTLYVHASGSYAEGYTTNIKVQKNLNIKTTLSGGAITLAPYGSGLNGLKYRNSDNTSNPSYDILHTGNLVTGNNITISEPNSTGVRTISGPSNEYMASMAMPSNRYVDLTLGASGATYTAPADGWYCIQKKATGNQYVLLKSREMDLGINLGTNDTCYLHLPCRKNDNVKIFYTANGTTERFRFVYAVGSQPTT